MSLAMADPGPHPNKLPLFTDPHAPTAAAPEGKRPVAVIGAGFSGVIATIQLLAKLPPDQPVLLCERAAEFARGLAYATGDAEHLLNVRATNMSALADEPAHFNDWLAQRAQTSTHGQHQTDSGLFASRGLYGQYLRSLLDSALRASAAGARLRLMPDDVTGAADLQTGGYTISFASGASIDVAALVLAVGNLAPDEHPHPNICANPWAEKASRPVTGDKPVLIVGTGLTMVDLVISLRRRGVTGRIVALSRGGLLSHHHAPTTPWPRPNLTDAELHSLRQLTARVRREIRAAAAQDVGWRAVIDSLRPLTPKIWRSLPPAEQARFLRHVRRFWDVHRHRMAPPNADLIDSMRRDGSLEIRAARVTHLAPTDSGVRVHLRPRGASTEEILDVQRVIFASGLGPVSRTRDPLVANLLGTGQARLDSHGFGLDVTENLNIIAADGTPSGRIWALGPIVRGVFWECIAVPDIRVQAAHMATTVAAALQAEAPRWTFVI
jgi:uncharacterized NAD(P)/FAD-binding protein YdhS